MDVVTGGASADWGSDAVAGVVNFVLDTNFTGLKGNIQGGTTTYGDDDNYKVALTGGTGFMDDRDHVLLSFEVAGNDGIRGVPRPWANNNNEELLFPNPTYTATNGQPEYLVRNNSGFATATPGGIITSGPLKGAYFGAGGAFPCNADYARKLEALKNRNVPNPNAATLGQLVTLFQASRDFTELSAKTCEDYSAALHSIRDRFKANTPLNGVMDHQRMQSHIEVWHDSMRATPRKADLYLAVLPSGTSF